MRTKNDDESGRQTETPDGGNREEKTMDYSCDNSKAEEEREIDDLAEELDEEVEPNPEDEDKRVWRSVVPGVFIDEAVKLAETQLETPRDVTAGSDSVAPTYVVNPRYEAMALMEEGELVGAAGGAGSHRNDFGIEPEHDRGPWLAVSNGRGTYGRFYPFHPSPKEVNLDWVLHHLSNLCRFTGATMRFYSVLEHSVHVGDMVWKATHDPHKALHGYLHDATEAVVGDLNRPIKHNLPDFVDIEDRVWRDAMAPAFGLSLTLPTEVHEADMRMALTEKRDLLPGSPPWSNIGDFRPYDELELTYDQFNRSPAGLVLRMRYRIEWCKEAAERV